MTISITTFDLKNSYIDILNACRLAKENLIKKIAIYGKEEFKNLFFLSQALEFSTNLENFTFRLNEPQDVIYKYMVASIKNHPKLIYVDIQNQESLSSVLNSTIDLFSNSSIKSITYHPQYSNLYKTINFITIILNNNSNLQTLDIKCQRSALDENFDDFKIAFINHPNLKKLILWSPNNIMIQLIKDIIEESKIEELELRNHYRFDPQISQLNLKKYYLKREELSDKFIIRNEDENYNSIELEQQSLTSVAEALEITATGENSVISDDTIC